MSGNLFLSWLFGFDSRASQLQTSLPIKQPVPMRLPGLLREGSGYRLSGTAMAGRSHNQPMRGSATPDIRGVGSIWAQHQYMAPPIVHACDSGRDGDRRRTRSAVYL